MSEHNEVPDAAVESLAVGLVLFFIRKQEKVSLDTPKNEDLTGAR